MSANNPTVRAERLPPRGFLYLTAAITGAAILVVEILGAKMLSPYVGSSHFVWTAQIAVTLISLALGYYFGGWLVDRSAALHRLYVCIAAAAAYLAVSVPVCSPITYYFLKNYNLALAAFLSSLFLFFIPLTLLAATGPFLIRVLTQSVQGVGGQVGRLSAISTLGSVAGTVLIGYVLLPFLPNSTTMFLTAGTLFLLSGFYLVAFARGKSKIVGVWVSALLMAGLSWGIEAKPQVKTFQRLFRGNSNFGEIQVIEQKTGGRRFYLNDFLVQNTYDPVEKVSLSLFTYMLRELAWGYSTNLKSALCIGMGIGIVPRELAREGVQTDVVEINPAIVPVAEKYFDFDPGAVSIHIGDGRYFINKTQKHYDAIVLDAFLGDSSPSHLMTKEAFAEMSRLLGQDGVLVINSFGDFAPGRDYFLASLDKTLRAAFKNVNIHASGRGNVFYAASNRDLKLNVRPNLRFPEDLLYEFNAATTVAPPPNPGSGIVLTDDFNPVDFYDAANRERHRRTLAFSMRDL
ncbi:MAG TPA: fused MFS/spermidine synthase [Verrucomicrobiae bacterium]|nr:fused MFS/spermidine synthase [Verrucomicrobiae bacterium]